MEDIISRIKTYMASKELTGSSLARKLSISSVTVNQYLSGKRKVSWEFVSALLDYDKELSSEWLTRGIGDMIIANSNESEPQITRELADAKVKMLVQEGIIDKLLGLIGRKMEGSQEVITQKHERMLG